MTVSAQLIADLAQGVLRSVVGLLLLAPSLGPAFAENLQLFPTELKARQHCDPSDIVVWLNTATGIYTSKECVGTATLPAAHLSAGRMGIGRLSFICLLSLSLRTRRLKLDLTRSISESERRDSSPQAHRYPDQSGAAR